MRILALETTSQRALSNCSREVREEPKTRKTKNHVVEHQKITANNEPRHLRLMILVLFHVWEEVRVWAL